MKRLWRTVRIGVLACCALALATPMITARAAEPESSLQELLDLFGMNQEFFNTFVDDVNLSDTEQQQVYKLLFRLRDLPPADIQNRAQGEASFRRLTARPQAERGKLFHIEGVVHRAVQVELDEQQQARYQLPSLFRCDMVTADGTPVEVLARAIPNDWKRDKPIEERASFRGMFVKRLASSDQKNAGPLLFVTTRVAWFPTNLLGKIGMDAGLLDEVYDRRPISSGERESFYQLLAAVERSKPGTLDREADAQLALRREQLPAKISELAGNVQEQANLQRELKKAELNLDDVVPLFNHSELQHGKLFVLQGDARRAIEVKVEDPDIVRRFGIHKYYEVEVLTDDSQSNPIVFCVASLPPGMPQGEDIHEHVRIAGFFLKSWAYPIRRVSDGVGPDGRPVLRQQLAPLLMGRQPQWTPKDALRGSVSQTMLGVLAAVSVLIAIWLWRQRRSDKTFYRAALLDKQFEPQPGALDDLGKLDLGPDFSKLD